MTRRAYLGLANTFHDSAVAVVDDAGEILFAEATERFLQSKRAVNAIPDYFQWIDRILEKYCGFADEVIPAFSWQARDVDTVRRLLEQARALTSASLDSVSTRQYVGALTYTMNAQAQAWLQPGFGLNFAVTQMARPLRLGAARHFPHHLTHAAAACLTSPFAKAVCAVIDGFGETSALSCFRYEAGQLTAIEEVTSSPLASFGGFYSEICNACGFGYLTGEEWKVMGLAAYGRPNEELRRLLRQMIEVRGLGIACPAQDRLAQLRNALYETDSVGRRRFSIVDIARTGQEVFTEVVSEFLSRLHAATAQRELVLSGGCALNSSTNGRILEETPFEELFVFCAPADDGNAVGAALLAQRERSAVPPRLRHQSPYLGSQLDSETIARARRFGSPAKVLECADSAPERAAELLAAGQIVGWLQGRAEFGPRALGNRSILADPRSASSKDELNSRVKFRESFRPFAPAILDEYGADYFHDYRSSPYMERTLRFRSGVLSRVPGVVHEDGTGRVQSVRREWNEPFHRLIARFHQLTGVPLVLNTSYNVMGKPIVHSVEDALAVFHTSGLDAVFIENTLFVK